MNSTPSTSTHLSEGMPERSVLTAGRHPGRLGPGLQITGEITAAEDLIVDAQVTGNVHAPDHAVSIAAGAGLRGRIFARVVLIEGAVAGEVTATGVIHVAEGARVEADLMAPSIGIAEGAYVVGKLDMRRAEAAAHVARYRADRAADARARDQAGSPPRPQAG